MSTNLSKQEKQNMAKYLAELNAKHGTSYSLDKNATGYSEKIGRNTKCPCGSGKKYKLCCLNKTVE